MKTHKLQSGVLLNFRKPFGGVVIQFAKHEKVKKVALTPEQVKANFEREGKTLAQWARENGYKPRDVYLVTGGLNKAKYGKGHEIAVKLGLKGQPNENA